MPCSTAREILVRPAYATIAAEAPYVRAALGLSPAGQHGTRNPSAARLRHMRLAAYAATFAARAEQFPHMAYRFVGVRLLRFFRAAAPTNI